MGLKSIELINLIQNDEWVHYETVSNFLSGNYFLSEDIGATFYLQGLIAAAFSKLFGMSALWILTLIFSFGVGLLCYLILKKFFNQTTVVSILITLIVLFNPLFVYSSFGFMMENYYLFFVLLAYLIFLLYEKKRNTKFLVLCIITSLLPFFIRQTGLFFPISLAAFYFMKKRHKDSLIFFLVSLGLYIFYQYVFPKTPIMMSKSVDISLELNNLRLIFEAIIYLVTFSVPLVAFFIIKGLKRISIKQKIFYILISILMFIFLVLFIGINEYPYWGNTFTRKGFFSGGLSGNKYHFKGFYDLFTWWEYLGIGLTAALLGKIIVKRPKLNFSIIYIIVSIIGFAVLPYVYDRYITVLIPFFLFSLIKNIRFNNSLAKLSVVTWIFFLSVLSYQYLQDYLSWQRYVHIESRDLVEQGIDPTKIHGNLAWRRFYNVNEEDSNYYFTFDSPEKFKYKNEFNLVQQRQVNFKYSLFIDSNVYLYERFNNEN